MAAHKCTINVTASVLPDHMRQTVGGTATYNLNDIGDNNQWVYYISHVTTTARGAVDTGVGYLYNDAGGATGDTPLLTTQATDDLRIIVIKHTGFKSDGVTKTDTDSRLYINVGAGDAAGPAVNAGNLFLLPGEVWWGRFVHSDLDDISLEASTETINAAIYAIVDVGGVS